MTPERALDTWLDAMVAGAPPQPDRLDGATQATVERLFRADDVPGLTPDVADQVWRTVLHSIDPVSPPASGLRPVQDLEWGSASVNPRLQPRTWRLGGRPRVSALATAALVLIMLLGSLIVLHGPSLPQPDQPITISVGEPGRSLTTLAATLVEEWPAPGPLLRVTLRRETFAPGAVEEFGVPETTGDALDLLIVEAGVLTMEADGPLTIWRVGDASRVPETLAAGTTVQLYQGDQALSPSGVAVRRGNAAAEPAVILSVLMTQAELLTFPPGVTNVRYVPDSILNKPWPAPATLSLRRVQLQPGAQFPLLELPGLQLLYVEEGTVDLIGTLQRGDLAPEKWDAIPAGQGATYFETTSALANSAAEPATFLVVTVETDG